MTQPQQPSIAKIRPTIDAVDMTFVESPDADPIVPAEPPANPSGTGVGAAVETPITFTFDGELVASGDGTKEGAPVGVGVGDSVGIGVGAVVG